MLDKKRVGTFVLGGLAGALAAVFFAPKSGKEFRGSITSRAGEARERSRETYFEAQERMQEHVSRAREHSFSPKGSRVTEREEVAPDTLSQLGPTTSDPVLEEPPVGGASLASPGPPPLRDASRPASREEPDAPDTEEIRRKILETRSRLRAQLDILGREDNSSGNRDE